LRLLLGCLLLHSPVGHFLSVAQLPDPRFLLDDFTLGGIYVFTCLA
jgi:hypothetical protein